MTWTRLHHNLKRWLAPSTLRWEIREELEFHLEESERRLRRRGHDGSAARRLALNRFGDPDRHRHSVLQVHRLGVEGKGRGFSMSQIWQDLRFGLRMFRKKPVFTLTAVLALALAIGANTAVYSLVHGILLRPLSYADAETLVVVFETDRHNGTRSEGASIPDFFDFKERNHVFESMMAFSSGSLTLTRAGDTPRRVTIAQVSEGTLPELGFQPAIGRGFASEEEQIGGPRAVLLGHDLWKSAFGRRDEVVGENIELDGTPYQVVGVMPPSVPFPSSLTEVWMPLRMTSTTAPRGNHGLSVLARLAPGVDIERASSDMTAVAAQLEAEYPQDNAGRGVRLAPLREQLVGSIRPVLFLLWGAVVIVLLIACANVANLLLARASIRSRETAVRNALGAGRRRLAQQFLTESLLLALGSALVGVALAYGGLHLLTSLGPQGVPRLSAVRIDASVLLFTVGVAVVAALLFGLLPSLMILRGRLAEGLGDASRGASTGRGGSRLARILVTVEVAAAVMLVIGAGLLMRSLWQLQKTDPGFRAQQIVKVDFQLPASKYPQQRQTYPDWPEVLNFFDEVTAQVGGLPGIQSVALGMNHPMESGWTTRFVVDGRPPEDADKQTEANIRPVSSAYFSTLGIRLLQGRDYSSADHRDSASVILINEALARRFFGEKSPVGERISFWGQSREIVGVVADVKFQGLGSQTPIAIYPPLAQIPMTRLSLMVKTATDSETVIEMLRSKIAQIDSDLAVFGTASMDELLSASVAQPRFNAWMLGVFALTALLIAVVGIFGVLSQAVERQRHAMGVRLALGARPADLLRRVVGQGLILTLAGTLVGAVGAFALTRVLSGLLYQVSPLDPLVFVSVAAVVALTALLASLIPALRASQADPLDTLRAE